MGRVFLGNRSFEACASMGTIIIARRGRLLKSEAHLSSGSGLVVGRTYSEGTRPVRALCRQVHDGPHAHADEECVALFGSGLIAEGEAFPVVASGGELSC